MGIKSDTLIRMVTLSIVDIRAGPGQSRLAYSSIICSHSFTHDVLHFYGNFDFCFVPWAPSPYELKIASLSPGYAVPKLAPLFFS